MKKDTPKGANKQNMNDTASHTQRTRILLALESVGGKGLSTLELREKFNIMHPAGRIQELRDIGLRIDTIWITEDNAAGYSHRVAKYVLIQRLEAV